MEQRSRTGCAKEVTRGSAKGKGKSRSGEQETNVIQWLNTNDQMMANTMVNDLKVGAGTSATTSVASPSGLGGHSSSSATTSSISP
jgi:hypothetical protein